MNALKTFCVLLFLLSGIVLGVNRCGSHGADTEKKDSSFFLNLNDTVNYVGISACRSCHEDHYSTFIQTGMGRSFGPVSRERSKALIQTRPVYDAKKNMYYFSYWRQEKLYIMEFRLKGKDTIHKRVEQVTHIIGSGHHTNSHFWMDKGYLFQAPLTFYTQQKQWDLPPGYENVNTQFGRKIDIECMSCHNAIPQLEAGSVNKFTSIPAGIDCERCHGPGELHVNLKSKGIIVDTKKEADRSIVNPARLPWKLQVDICQRCHLQGNNVLKPGKNFSDFRPGMKLSDVFDVFMPGNQQGSFAMAAHAERLQMSKCFLQSNKNETDVYNAKLNLTCITCHNPHVSVRQTNTEKFNTACRNCHAETGISTLKKCSEDAQKLAAQKNNCVHCHMPANNTRDIPHVTVHDHYIRKDYSKSGLAKKSLLYAVNDKNPDRNTEILGYITWFEKFDSKREFMDQAGVLVAKSKEAPDAKIMIHFWYANAAWSKIVDFIPKIPKDEKDAWTNYRVAKALDLSGQLEQALPWYKTAVLSMNKNADFQVEYANALLRMQRFSEAQNLMKKLLEEQPKNVLALVNAGAAFSQDNSALAIQYLKKAIALQPDIENAYLYLADIYLMNKNTAAARSALEEAARLNPANIRAERKLNSLGN